ncbi:unnamed protein product [Cuscuta epithymum]|uniref:Replication factor A C-terminal domain-containing protein n=1 Tax=Cuscuta epithymum TaxID=186058 RepID=A0AAV0CF75_9ASTE|nr:unnamed protein product [Cuscuta epithymum]
MSHSTITLNSDLPRAAELEKWAIDHKSTLDAVKAGRKFLDAGFHLANPDNETITPVAKVPAIIPQGRPIWIKGTITLVLENYSLWYIACSHCAKIKYAGCDAIFHCMSCGQENAYGVPRAKLHVTIEDETGSVSGIMFGLCAEKLLLMTSKQVMEIESQGKKASFPYINKRLAKEEYIVQLRSSPDNWSSKNNYPRTSKTSYIITSLHESSLHIIKMDEANVADHTAPNESTSTSSPPMKRIKTV